MELSEVTLNHSNVVNTANDRATNYCTELQGTQRVRTTVEQHWSKELTITNHQGLQSSSPKVKERLREEKGQVNYITIQCMARRQPR